VSLYLRAASATVVVPKRATTSRPSAFRHRGFETWKITQEGETMTNTETTNSYTFRLQSSIVEELRKVAEEQGKTLDQYANLAVAEKLAAVRDFAYLEERAERTDMGTFMDFLENGGGNEPPREGDEIPEG
jgi:hypothetical protein